MNKTIIYHNPRCSKSREAMKILQGKKIDFVIRDYLQVPPDVEEIKGLLKKLKLPIRDMMRTGEEEYSDLGLANASEDKLIESITLHPILLQRPLVVHGNKAIIARPPSLLEELF